MAMIVMTTAPKKLLAAIEAGIKDGSIVTWSRENDGGFVHTTRDEQWTDRAKLYLSIAPGEALLVKITGPSHEHLKVRPYAIYLGRFAEMLLAHFDKMFTSIQMTALLDPDAGDEP